MDVFKTAKDLVDEGLEMGIGQRLAGSDNGRQIALHQFYCALATVSHLTKHCFTFVEICLVEVVRAGNVHVIETGDL